MLANLLTSPERQRDVGVPDALDLGPRDQQLGGAVADEDPLDQMRPGRGAKPHGEIGDATGRPAVGPEHVVTGHPAQQEHSRSMPG